MSTADRDRVWWDQRRSIGALSVWLGAVALFAPRAMTRLLGVRADATQDDAALPLLVRLIAARNIAMGAALLVSPPPQARRTSEVTLLLTGLDAAAVLVSRRTGDVAGRSALLSLLVLATTLVGVVQWHRQP
ncbi:DUF4267 domain-containing protein [Quadrisphaera sp. INWT6]|uniref:DUF4267 domain-containing protein n=1 Tax=Quadrisphaera sp. INWT6 TaxID=2596917 RepID=UPI001892066C|nr:DUF4267 domain-containing protein [Quadrisphaera sp. INWT6]MBF5081745.1 DUF4267 domain-containing protein [Quadrisphaera sp. INWT6]